MSDTTFVHELRPGTPVTRVMLTMDMAEVMALGLISMAAIDASVLAHGTVDEETERNANEMVRWTGKAIEALIALTPSADDAKE